MAAVWPHPGADSWLVHRHAEEEQDGKALGGLAVFDVKLWLCLDPGSGSGSGSGPGQVMNSSLDTQDKLLVSKTTTCRAERSRRSFLTCHQVSVSAARPLFTASNQPRTSS